MAGETQFRFHEDCARVQYDLDANGARWHRIRWVLDEFRCSQRTREKGVSRTRCRIPGLPLFCLTFPCPPHNRYVRHVCLRNIFFAELRAIILSTRPQPFSPRKQDWINVICSCSGEKKKSRLRTKAKNQKEGRAGNVECTFPLSETFSSRFRFFTARKEKISFYKKRRSKIVLNN